MEIPCSLFYYGESFVAFDKNEIMQNFFIIQGAISKEESLAGTIFRKPNRPI